MIGVLKRAARNVAAAAGLFDMTRRVTARWPRIIAYHGFCGPDEDMPHQLSATEFRRQLAYITEHYRPLRLSTLGELLAAGEAPPPYSVVLTVDDGYTNFARWALPLLDECGVPATLAVVSDLADSGGWLWADAFRYVCAHATGTPELRGADRAATHAALKHMPAAQRDARLAELASTAGVTIPEHPPEPYAMLSWSELREVATSGLVEIAAHTRTHPLLSHLDEADAWNEIAQTRQIIEQRIDAPVRCFCYPNGLAGDYAPEHVSMVRRAGYVCATASHFGLVTKNTDRFALPRIGGNLDWMTFRKYLDGFEHLQQRLTRRR